MELEARFDTRKSFYGKAHTETQRTPHEISVLLWSYSTNVASIIYNLDNKKIIYNYYGYYSQTTTRHQKEFFKQNDLTDDEIKTLFKNGTLEKDL